MTPRPDLLAELDAASVAAGQECWCGHPPDVCEDSGGCPASREVARLREDAGHALAVIAILLRADSDSVEISDEDILREAGTLVRVPEPHGYSVRLREDGGRDGP